MTSKKRIAASTTKGPAEDPHGARKRWVKLSPRDHILKQIEAQQKFVESLRSQLQKEEQTLQGMEKAKEFLPE